MSQILNDDENATLGTIVCALQGIEENLNIYVTNPHGLNQLHCMMTIIVKALGQEYQRLTQFQR